jgi:uncharacterized protein YegJ (DUF2314 family)
MSESERPPVFLFGGDDPEMEQAGRNARKTFRYFWRELAWERRRIVPALDMATVKAPFSDGKAAARAPRPDDAPQVEHMWVADVDFDGRDVRGELLNSPNWLTSVKQGDPVKLPLGRVTDWMYVIGGEVYGAYTVQLMRSRMGRAERAAHDQAWGLNFGDPATVRLAPAPKRGGLLKGLLGKRPAAADAPQGDHPMSVNMGSSLREAITKDRSFMTNPDDRSWTLLHHLALAGSTSGVKVLLDLGADPATPTRDGRTAAQLAESLGWDEVVNLLKQRRA